MATYEYSLVGPPDDEQRRQLWLQHAAGFILFEDVRGYARGQIDPALPPDVRTAVEKGIDDALYGLMMVIDGVSGGLQGPDQVVELEVTVRHRRTQPPGEDTVIASMDLADGDGVCMGYHYWMDGVFGEDPVAQRRTD